MTDASDHRLVFLDVRIFDHGAAVRGGMLITDVDTRPYEFRCTSAVRPTPLQRVLYGSTLDEYVNVELIALPLLKAAREEPTAVLVRAPLLLNVRPHLKCPVIALSAEAPAAAAGAARPIAFTAHPSFPAEAASVQSILAPLMQRRDLLEPFDRLAVALTEAHKENIGEEARGKRT